MTACDLPIAAAFTFEIAEDGEYLRVIFDHEDGSSAFRLDERFASELARAIGNALAEARTHRGL
jgi:hypothetical protein